VRLTAVGPARAEAIVAYRREHGDANNGVAAFRARSDLERVKGIGTKTAEKIEPYVKFE
jgi:competence protein ComEA